MEDKPLLLRMGHRVTELIQEVSRILLPFLDFPAQQIHRPNIQIPCGNINSTFSVSRIMDNFKITH